MRDFVADRADFLLLTRKAEVASSRFERELRSVLSATYEEIAIEVQDAGYVEDYVLQVLEEMEDEITRMHYERTMPMLLDSYHMGERLIGKKCTRRYTQERFTFNQYAKIFTQPNFEVYGDDEFVARRMRPQLSKWIEKTSTQESKWHSQRIAGVINRTFAGEFGEPSRELAAKMLLKKGLASTPARAKLMADTTATWAYNKGAIESFKEDGYTTLIWVTNSGDPCEFCQSMDGTIFPMDENLFTEGVVLTGVNGGTFKMGIDVEHPPLHPHCLCSVMPSD